MRAITEAPRGKRTLDGERTHVGNLLSGTALKGGGEEILAITEAQRGKVPSGAREAETIRPGAVHLEGSPSIRAHSVVTNQR